MSETAIRVLLVEDDQVDRLACRRALARETGNEFALIETDTGEEGLALARACPPDLILLDYQLPDLDGLAFLTELAGGAREPAVPVVMLTGADSAALAVEALRRGASDYLVKDSERRYLEHLPAVIERALRERRLRMKLHEAEMQLHTVISNAPVVLWALDREGQFTLLEGMALASLGLQPGEHVGRSIFELYRDHPQILEYNRRALRGESFVATVELRGRLFEAHYAPLRDAEGEVAGVIGVAVDVTERKRTEKELMERHQELARLARLHTAGIMTSAIAHELNQPLHALAAYCEAAQRLVRAGNPNPDKLVHALDQAALQAQRAGHVIRNLRAFLGKGETETESLDLNALVRTAMTLLEDEVNANGLRTELDLAAELPPVVGNRTQIEQVLINLALNSVEAMRDAGMRSGRIEIRTFLNREHMAQVTVRDTGPGLDPEAVQRVFHPFYTSKPSGLGVGLAISRRLVELQGGQLWAEDKPPPGATFHFTVPLAP